MFYKKTLGDRIFDFVVYFLIITIMIVTLYPLIYVFSMSISDPIAAARGDVWLLPVGFDLTAIKKVLSDNQVLKYYGNTIWFTVVGTICGVITTCLAAYPLSRREFRSRNIVMKFVMITMFFNGGTVHLPDPPWDIAFTIDRNVWRGRTSVSMSIQDIRPSQSPRS